MLSYTHIIGCGGHGRVILDILLSVQRYPNDAPNERREDIEIQFVDDDSTLWGRQFNGFPVIGGTDKLEPGASIYLGIGDNIQRRNLFLRLKQLGCSFPTLISPTAVVSPNARIDEGAVICHRAVVQTCAHIGANSIINTAAVVEHDCFVAPSVQLAPMVALSGGVRIGEGTLLGTGVSVNVDVSIGEFCLVSPGLPVTQNLPDHAVLKINHGSYQVETNHRLSEISPSRT